MREERLFLCVCKYFCLVLACRRRRPYSWNVASVPGRFSLSFHLGFRRGAHTASQGGSNFLSHRCCRNTVEAAREAIC